MICSGTAAALQLQVAIARPKAPQEHPNAPARSSRATLLADFNTAVAREACRRLNARCVFWYPDFPEIIPGVESGRFQLGFGTYLRTPEREARVAFSDPLFRSASRLLAFPRVAARFASPAGAEITLDKLRGARIVVIGGSQQQRHLQSLATAHRLEVLTMMTMGDCLEALYEEQADFALLPVLGAYLVLDPAANEPPTFVGPGLIDEGLGGSVHVALPRDDQRLRQSVNAALTAMRRDGTYQRLWRQHFSFDLD